MNKWEYYIGTTCYLKYQVVCSLGTQRVINLAGPYKGPASDTAVFHHSGVSDAMFSREKAMADKLYRFETQCITPVIGKRFNLADALNTYNYTVYSARQAVERLIKRIKNFGCIKSKWPYSIELHRRSVVCAAKLSNYYIVFKPLTKA